MPMVCRDGVFPAAPHIPSSSIRLNSSLFRAPWIFIPHHHFLPPPYLTTQPRGTMGGHFCAGTSGKNYVIFINYKHHQAVETGMLNYKLQKYRDKSFVLREEDGGVFKKKKVEELFSQDFINNYVQTALEQVGSHYNVQAFTCWSWKKGTHTLHPFYIRIYTQYS